MEHVLHLVTLHGTETGALKDEFRRLRREQGGDRFAYVSAWFWIFKC